MDLVIIWSCLLGLAIILYVILDGFSLGVALLFRSTRNEEERDILMNSIAPVWDANQTWLVFGGGALLVAFPMIYGVLFSALYIPLFTFIFGLIFRGVAFEFRANATRKGPWNMAFFFGSLVAVVAQGLTLGGILSGTKVAGDRFAGGPFDWLNPFSMTVGMALIAGYILLGSTYLIIKTAGRVHEWAYRKAFRSAFIVLVFQVVVTIWTPIHYPSTFSNWISPPRVYFIWAFPLIGLFAFYEVIRNLRARREVLPFVFSVVFFFAGYLGLIASIYPYVVPPNITFQEAAAQRETLRFTLWGAVIVLPLVLGYTAYSYSIFRGKVGEEGYHY
ncbi:MAG TPA: cytochrome d ubiquinol oxidase subunit II [Thermodesulfobacteriota bacterium]|nr:cytochrome d ubiquinol oxidase subunit II [Thermodesulfobacteriota bacterium]